jgi:hypothetical protein
MRFWRLLIIAHHGWRKYHNQGVTLPDTAESRPAMGQLTLNHQILNY